MLFSFNILLHAFYLDFTKASKKSKSLRVCWKWMIQIWFLHH